jgi:6-phosphofructokinase 1
MNNLKGACIIGQSGGPTSVINASAYGAIKTALESPYITRVLGAAHGIVGVLNDVLYDMGAEDPDELALLLNTPSSELGSCRYKLKDPEQDDSDYRKILEIFKKYDVRYFFYNGGNDSMDTCMKISRFMSKTGYECRVIGIPKTIDNDLSNTDHCPGFGSAAKYIATSLMEVYKDSTVYDIGTVTIVEAMGRHAGWLAGSASIASYFGSGPDLVYLPEISFDLDAFLTDVERIYKQNGKVLAVVSEGIRDKDGVFISEYGTKKKGGTDSFGHKQLGGLAATLADLVKEKTGAKVRGIELSLLQRCAAHIASQTDIKEAFEAGKAAVEAAVAGKTGKMVAFKRETDGGGYACRTVLIPLEDAANYEKKVPLEWINKEGNGVTKEFIDYVLPLIQGEPERKLISSLPRFAKLKKIRVSE